MTDTVTVTERPKSRVRTFFYNTGLVLASTAVFALLVFAAGEVVMRLQFGSVPPGPNSSFYSDDETLGWVPRPGSYSFFHVKAFRRVDLSINDFGLRNEPITATPAEGRERISVVGDSFVFGAAQSDGETLTDTMQSLTNGHYEIVNVSAERYGTGQQIRLLERLEEQGYEAGSKLVLVFFTNDILDNLAQKYDGTGTEARQPSFRVDDAGQLVQVGPVLPDRSGETGGPGFYSKSLFYRYLMHNLETVATAYPDLTDALFAAGLVPSLPRRPGVISAWYDEGWEERWANTREILAYFVDRLRQSQPDLEIYIAFMPSPFQVHDIFSRMVREHEEQDQAFEQFLANMDRPQQVLQEFAEAEGLPFIDPTPALRRVPMAYFPREGHLNQRGTEVVAQVLMDGMTGQE